MKVVRLNQNLLPVTDEERQSLREMGFTEIVEMNGDSPEEIIQVAKDADVIIIQAAKVGRQIIEKLERCKQLCRYGIGTDNIDVQSATERGIIVTNVPDFCLSEMADHTMALLLGVARNLVTMHHSVENGTWIQEKLHHQLLRIQGKTLGLIGFGGTAKEVALRAKPFGLRVIDYHRHVNPEEERQYGVEPVSWETLLSESDFLVVLCALTPETTKLIGEKELRMMKKNAILINTSRGAIVDEYALAKALREGWIGGAGMDCFYHLNMFKEPEVPLDSPYFGLKNMIMTPHIGGTSELTSEECITKGVAEIKRTINGKWPKNVVNRSVKPWFPLQKE
jgi:D-3-phosphoglycerate dehydrogenase